MIIRRRTFLAASTALALTAPSLAQQVAQTTASSHKILDIPGGRHGRILRVTTLEPTGPGSITEAIRQTGPRITFIRGGIEISQGTRNVVIRHIAVRPGEAGQAKKSGWECDGIYAYGASEIDISNCSITWATDEGLSASGKRFGKDDKAGSLEEWRAFTSRDIVFSNNIVAEGLSNSTHSKGEHSKGTLIHDNVRNVQVTRSLYAHNMERNILLKGGAQGMMTQCVVYNPGRRFAHYNLHEGEWGDHAYQVGNLLISNNVFLAGPSTDKKAAIFMLGGEGDLELDMRENYGLTAGGEELALTGRFGSGKARLIERPRSPNARIDATIAGYVQKLVLDNCGARPWERDPIDARIVADVKAGTGRIIDSEQDVGGYPVRAATKAAFVEAEWNLQTMERR